MLKTSVFPRKPWFAAQITPHLPNFDVFKPFFIISIPATIQGPPHEPSPPSWAFPTILALPFPYPGFNSAISPRLSSKLSQGLSAGSYLGISQLSYIGISQLSYLSFPLHSAQASIL